MRLLDCVSVDQVLDEDAQEDEDGEKPPTQEAQEVARVLEVWSDKKDDPSRGTVAGKVHPIRT